MEREEIQMAVICHSEPDDIPSELPPSYEVVIGAPDNQEEDTDERCHVFSMQTLGCIFCLLLFAFGTLCICMGAVYVGDSRCPIFISICFIIIGTGSVFLMTYVLLSMFSASLPNLEKIENKLRCCAGVVLPLVILTSLIVTTATLGYSEYNVKKVTPIFATNGSLHCSNTFKEFSFAATYFICGAPLLSIVILFVFSTCSRD